VVDSLAASAQGAAARLAVLTTGLGDATMATILSNIFTRMESGRVGTMNATEMAIAERAQRRSATGLVGSMNPTEQAIAERAQRRSATGLVGNLNPVYAEISRRLFFRDDRASRVDADLVGIYLRFFTRLVVNI
jgi:hypothetical protein